MAGAELVEKIRNLCHEATQRGEASELIVSSLELCDRFMESELRGLECELVIHKQIKLLEGLGIK